MNPSGSENETIWNLRVRTFSLQKEDVFENNNTLRYMDNLAKCSHFDWHH